MRVTIWTCWSATKVQSGANLANFNLNTSATDQPQQCRFASCVYGTFFCYALQHLNSCGKAKEDSAVEGPKCMCVGAAALHLQHCIEKATVSFRFCNLCSATITTASSSLPLICFISVTRCKFPMNCRCNQQSNQQTNKSSWI